MIMVVPDSVCMIHRKILEESMWFKQVSFRVMGSRGVNILLSRGSRINQKLQSAFEASVLEIEDVSYQHAGHAGVKGDANETHFNVKIVSSKFQGHSLVKRHRMVYDLLSEELQSGLHALSIVAKTPNEVGGS
ncbi:protein BOLA1, chloroplastic isoform X2 [Aristolochia californica]|uniref:protein BOLA1, chloroplastic isoform X2 n=1 Tax=Aristolochia californica TaxID=171875 RepID=UPI0035D6945A